MKFIAFFSLVALLFPCFAQKDNLPENFDFGKVDNGTYSNSFFELSVSFNPDWIVQDLQAVNNLIEQGSEVLLEDNQELKSIVKASKVNTAYLLTVFKHELDASVEYNPSVMLVAENTKNFPGIKTGKDYLFHARKLLERTQMAYSFSNEVEEKQFGSAHFHVMKTYVSYLGIHLTQEYISTVLKGFSLSFVISYTNEEEKNELYAIMESLKL